MEQEELKLKIGKIKLKRNTSVIFSSLSLFSTALRFVRDNNCMLVDSATILSGALTITFISSIFYYQKKYKKLTLVHDNCIKNSKTLKK